MDQHFHHLCRCDGGASLEPSVELTLNIKRGQSIMGKKNPLHNGQRLIYTLNLKRFKLVLTIRCYLLGFPFKNITQMDLYLHPSSQCRLFLTLRTYLYQILLPNNCDREGIYSSWQFSKRVLWLWESLLMNE